MSEVNTFHRFRKESVALLKLGLPVIVAQLLMMSMSFVDTVMAGNYDAPDLAAVAVGFSLFSPLLTFGSGVLMALSPIVSQNLGARRLENIGKNVRQTFWIGLLISIPAFFLLRNFGPVISLLDLDPDVHQIAIGYIQAISWGAFPLFGFLVLRYFNEGLGNTAPAMYISIIGLFFNIAGNYTLIYGNLGFPELGGVGTGVASAIVIWVMFLSVLIYTLGVRAYRRFKVFKIGRGPDIRLMYEILRLGLPIGVSSTMEVTMFAITTLLMGYIGTLAVAGHQIALNFASLTFMIPFGLSTAITIRVGLNKGRGSISRARFSGLTGIVLSTMIMAVTCLVMFTFAENIASFYSNDVSVIPVAVGLIYMAAIFQISDGLQVSGYGALRGLKDTKIPMYFNIAAYWLIGLPTGCLLGFVFDYGASGMWVGLIAGLTVAAVLHNIRFFRMTHQP